MNATRRVKRRPKKERAAVARVPVKLPPGFRLLKRLKPRLSDEPVPFDCEDEK
jgi:hypothetical protein